MLPYTPDDGVRRHPECHEVGDLALVMTAVAESLHRQADTEDVLRAMVRAARDTIPGAQHAGISVAHRNGRIETVAASDQLVYEVDELQYRLREGPCVETLSGQQVSAVEDLASDDRWPRYAPAAVRLGVASQLGLKLDDEERTLAGLNLYSPVPHAFGTDTVQIAGLFAVHAAHALGRRLVEQQLTEALSTRQVIGQAVGIVMERYRLNEQEAFTFLVHASQDSRTKLRFIAAQIVDDVDRKSASRARREDHHRATGEERAPGA